MVARVFIRTTLDALLARNRIQRLARIRATAAEEAGRAQVDELDANFWEFRGEDQVDAQGTKPPCR